MVFSSLTFIYIFLPVVLILYFMCKNIKQKNLLLLISSLIFYAWGEPIYIILMITSICTTYYFGLLIDKKENKKIYLILSIVILISLLLFFKYGNFLIANINYIFKLNIKNINLPLPIGISFYTFQAISYLADLYCNKIKVQKSWTNLALYISLFPQLIAGPIVRYETIEKEINVRTHSLEKFDLGIKRFIIGLSKKVILANSMGTIADVVLNNPSQYGSIIIWIGGIAYSLQIYFDFSGYSDMAIGLGKIFGFTFLENFNFPYIASSITDFWRRWHISLSSFFKDYVYIPLGGSRVSKLKNIRNILVVWVFTGIWHGASWNFIIWGLYFGIILLLEKFVLKDFIEKLPNMTKHIFTLILVIISWIIFYNTNINNLLICLKTMFIFKSSNIVKFFYDNAYLIFNFYIIIPAIIFSIPFNIKKLQFNNDILNYIYNIFIDGIYMILLLVSIAFISGNSFNPFIYFRF